MRVQRWCCYHPQLLIVGAVSGYRATCTALTIVMLSLTTLVFQSQVTVQASSALPTLIAAAPMEVAVADELERRHRRHLQWEESTFLEALNNVAGTSTPEDKLWPPPNGLLRSQVAEARKKVTLRDNDVVIVSFPKSGTHWLASVISEALYPGYSTNESVWWNQFRARVPRNAFFHDFPILWLLPEARVTSSANLADSVYQDLDAVPENVPRIFLSHMPTVHFEFKLAPKTKLIVGQDERIVNETANAAAFTWDFNRGRIPFPPRQKEIGPEFAWGDHVRRWWSEIAAEDRFGKDSAATGNRVVVDFTTAMDNASAAVQKLLDFLAPVGAFAHQNRNAELIAELGSYARVREAHSKNPSSLSQKRQIELKLHFPEKSQSSGNDKLTWKEEFQKLPRELQDEFHEYTQIYSEIKNGRGQYFRVVGLVLP